MTFQHNTTKSPSDTTSTGQNKQSTLIVLPGGSSEKRPPSPQYPTLFELFKLANRAVGPQTVEGILYESCFGMDSQSLRKHYGIHESVPLRQTIQQRSYPAYLSLLMAEEALRFAVLKLIAERGEGLVPLHVLYDEISRCASSYRQHRINMGNYLGIDLLTWEAIVDDEEDEIEDDENTDTPDDEDLPF